MRRGDLGGGQGVEAGMRSVGWLVAGALTGGHAPPVQVPAQPVAAPTEPPVAEEPVPKDTSPAPRDERALQEAIARDLGDARAWEGRPSRRGDAVTRGPGRSMVAV